MRDYRIASNLELCSINIMFAKHNTCDLTYLRTRSQKCVITAKTRWKKCGVRDFSCPYLSE